MILDKITLITDQEKAIWLDFSSVFEGYCDIISKICFVHFGRTIETSVCDKNHGIFYYVVYHDLSNNYKARLLMMWDGLGKLTK